MTCYFGISILTSGTPTVYRLVSDQEQGLRPTHRSPLTTTPRRGKRDVALKVLPQEPENRDDCGSEVGEEGGHLAACQALALTDPARLVGNGDLEDRLCKIHGDSRRMLHGLLLSRVAMTPSHVGTVMPFMWQEEPISSLQRTRSAPPPRSVRRRGRGTNVSRPRHTWNEEGEACCRSAVCTR